MKLTRKAFTPLLILAMIVSTLTVYDSNSQNASAADASGFRSGRIIDDSVFTNYSAMSAADIQNFLNSKVTSCDTYGTQTSELGGGTRAQYAANASLHPKQGAYYPPFTCLKNYSENGLSSSQIIYNTAQQYQINPQVLLVLLQKEQSLVTDTWPSPAQYKTATGYGCPDSTPGVCDSKYYGFTNQLQWSAKMFRAILNATPTWYTPYVLGTNYIQYSPTASCGGSNVIIENRATQALYNYTPYQPNPAALAAGYGSATCGAYGNRNFYLYFTDWFGNTLMSNLPGCSEATNTTVACVWLLYNTSGRQYLTASNSFRDTLYVQNNYKYSSIAFYGNVVSMPGNIPVYRLTNPSGEVFLTTDKNEYNVLAAGGYTPYGIDFYAAPSRSNSGYPVYRLYSPTEGKHIWTIDPTMYQQYINFGFVSEGEAFSSISPINQETPPPTGKQLVYRFYIPQTKSHFWTTSLMERNNMVWAGYQYEGVAWYGSLNTNDMPVYRLYSYITGEHLYTTDGSERNNLAASGAWRDEGISQYVSNTLTNTPVYRLYSPVTKTHLLTQDGSERVRLVSSGIWNDEGIAWYQPN